MDKSARKFIVRMKGGYALKFYANAAFKKVFSAVVDDHATRFDFQWQAELKAKEFGMREGSFTVDEAAKESRSQESEVRN